MIARNGPTLGRTVSLSRNVKPDTPGVVKR